jgi:hypothetical protein
MALIDDEEARAKAWLSAQGYDPFRPTELQHDHPARLSVRGENPDYWAENEALTPPHLWVEVKSIAPEDTDAAMARFRSRISAASIPSGLRGHAMLEFHPNAIEQSIQWVLKSFAKRAATFVGQKVSLIFLQQTQNCNMEFLVEIDVGMPILIWARAKEFPLHLPTWFRDDTIHTTARVHAPDGSEVAGPAHQFFDCGCPIECVLVVRLDPQDRMLGSIASMCGGTGQMRERTVSALEKANSQIKSACTTLDAPGLVILTPRGPFADNDQAMQAAIYGQYTIPFQMGGDHVEDRGMFHGNNGVFRRNKNTHISAAVHVRRHGPATFFPNPYARHLISEKARVFSGAARANVKFIQSQDRDTTEEADNYPKK